jgi:hypothetical protein
MDLRSRRCCQRSRRNLLRRHPFRGLIPFRRCFSTCSFGTKEIQNTSDSHPMPRWQPEKEWAEPPIPWNELVTRWNQSRDLLEEKIRNFPIEDLARQVPGRSYPYETMLHGIVQHAIYHSGQIAMILSMLRSRLHKNANTG